MRVQVNETRLAEAQAKAMRGSARKAYDAFLDDLAASGCLALGYRMTGPSLIERLCVKHLRGNDRAIVAFTADRTAWIVLVGPHNASSPERNVYDQLYELVGHRPPDETKRRKPSCCDEDGGAPPTHEDEVIALSERAIKAARRASAGRRSLR